MSRILVSHPYHLALDEREARLGKPYPPLNTLNAATLLKKAGHEVLFEDRSFDPDEAGFGKVLDQLQPELLAIMGDDHSVQMKQCIGRIREAQQAMSQAARRRSIPVLVSGPDVSDNPEIYLAAGADAAVVGEPVAVVGEWAAGEQEIQGLHGQAGAGGRRAPFEDLDLLPDTDWSLVDTEAYARAWRARHGYWELNISTAKGCPYTCNWCAKPTWGRSYAVRSAARVAAEIERVRTTLAPDRIWFTDDIFAIKPEWLRQFRRHLQRPVPYRCLSRADLLRDSAYAEDLRSTGCREVWIGAESGSDRILDAMDKGNRQIEIEEARENLSANGIRVGFFLQLGYPGETLADVEATIEMVRRLQPEQIGVSVSYPLPGTVFHERVSHSMQATHWQQAMDNRPLYEAPYGEGFYSAAKEVLRSTHSVGLARTHLRDLIAGRDSRSARRVLGSVWHGLRLPLVRRRMQRLAEPNPSAVPLSW